LEERIKNVVVLWNRSPLRGLHISGDQFKFVIMIFKAKSKLPYSQAEAISKTEPRSGDLFVK
jgi:hypothetical protein